MEIWLDSTPTHWFTRSECDDECYECKEHSNSPSLKFPPIAADLQHILTGYLQQAMPLHMQECSAGRWLVCNPTGSGQLVVLDQQTLFLLEQFRAPTSLSTVQHVLSTYPPEDIEEAVALFYSMGFLRELGECNPINKESQFHTLSAWLHVTNACNLRCDYCYLYKTSEHMASDTAQRAVDAVFRSATKQGFKQVKLKYSGGEASLHMANVVAIHDYAAQLAQKHAITLRASIFSNGVSLSQRAIAHLKERNIGIMISLDGIEAYHDRQRPFINGQGSFKYVDRTINSLLMHDFAPHISVTVSQRNLAGLPDLLSYILEREMTFSLNYYRDNECSAHINDLQFGEQQTIAAMRSAFAIIERQLPRWSLLWSLIDKASLQTPHHHTCGVGQSYLVIDQHGGIAKCHADIKRTVTTIDADDPLQVIKNDPTGVQGLSVDEKEGCRTCDWRYWCTGGCPLLTYRITGRSDVKSPNCNIYKALFPEALRLEAMRLLKYTPPVALMKVRLTGVQVEAL